VPSAVATLWPISDELAALFFPRLHEKLAAGLTPAEALREVQLDAIRRKDIPASLWAAVQVIGS
jgi:CHAT domain-containing protein